MAWAGMTALIGIAGSIVGGFVSSLIWKSPDGKFHPAGWIMSILGALVVLWAYLQFAQVARPPAGDRDERPWRAAQRRSR